MDFRHSGLPVFGAITASFLLSACTTTTTAPRDPVSLPAAPTVMQLHDGPGEFPKPIGSVISVPQAVDFNAAYGDVPSCAALQRDYDAAEWPKGKGLDTITRIGRKVRRRHSYMRDPGDEWNSSAAAMVRTEDAFRGDCDDLATTVVALARCAGVSPERLGLALVSTDGDASPEHMVGFYSRADGEVYAIGDTSGGAPKPLRDAYRPFAWAALEDLATWYLAEDLSARP